MKKKKIIIIKKRHDETIRRIRNEVFAFKDLRVFYGSDSRKMITSMKSLA